MLEVSGLGLAYGPIRAAEDISLQVGADEIVAIIGGNGAGKTSLLKGIAGLLTPTTGTVRFSGEDITRLAPHRRVGLGIALSPEGRQVFPDQSVADNLVLGAYARNFARGELEAEIEEKFALFPRLAERRNQPALTLSGGEQQMLAIARALMSRPRLLLLDEPSLGLAPIIVRDVFRIIETLRGRGISILIVEQMANLALKVSNRAYVIESGRITLDGKSADLLHDPRIRAAYLGVSHG
ncbi:MAG: ABC transporter ATP-binding protein [Rhizobiales bacterium PAR1]|nr:MAG: ABC transporter ATP-binding protein [Rhizobiales bacterium PAR1]